MRSLKSAAITVLICFASASSAKADCHFGGSIRYDLPENIVNIYTDAEGCGWNFKVGGRLAMESLSVEREPKNGRFGFLSRFQPAYLPNKGFRGADEFVLRACGAMMSERNLCTRLIYKVTVN